MYKINRLALLASVCFCVSAQAQITPIQGSDTISGSRTTINNNFSYLDGKISKGSGAPAPASCITSAIGSLYVNTTAAQPLSSLYLCANTAPGVATWELQDLQNGVVTSGAYQNPSWIVSLDWSKLINLPAFPNSQLEISNTLLPQRTNVNLIPGNGVTITTGDHPETSTTDVTISSTGGGGGGGSGTVNPGVVGQIAVYPSNGNAVRGVTAGQDATINTATGAVTVTGTQGTPFARSATTDATDPSNIPYTSPANGASVSNLRNLANTFLTPDSFGCHMVADSSTDNSCLGSAIQAALNAGNNIRIPAPNNTTAGSNHYYAVKNPLIITLQSHFPSDVNQGLTIECDGAGTTIAYAGTDTTQGLIKFIGSSGAGLDNVIVKGCTLASTMNAQYVVQFAGVSGPRLIDSNIRAANGVTVQYGVQFLGSQDGAVLGGSNTNSQTGIYLGTLFNEQGGTTSTTTTASVAPTDATISIASCGVLTGNPGTNVFEVDTEHIRASGCTSGTVTVAHTCGQLGTSLCRGMEGSSATAHASGAAVRTGSTIASNQIAITGGIQMVCNQNCVYADGIDNGLLEGNSLVTVSGNSDVLVNGSGRGTYKILANKAVATAGTDFYVLGGAVDIAGSQASGSAALNCATGICDFHDNNVTSGSITFAAQSTGSYHDNTLTGTTQAQISLLSPSLISYNNSLPTDVAFSTLAHIFRLDSPVVITSNYTPPGGDIGSVGVNSSAPNAAYGFNISGSSTSGQYAYLRFNKGIALGSAAGSGAMVVSTDNTFSGIIASFGNSAIQLNKTVTATQVNATATVPYQANGVNGATGVANIGSCAFTFNGILTAGVGVSPVSCGYYQTVLNGATPMAQRAKLEFTGAGVAVSDNGTDTTIVTISGGGGGGSGTVNSGTTNQLAYYAASGTTVSGATLGGDCTFTSPPSIVCTKTNGVNFAASATTDATNAANIGSGTLPAGRMPALTGDVTTSAGTVATTVVKVNGATIPASQTCLGSNASSQLITGTCTGGGGGGNANVPTATVSSGTATLFAACAFSPCNVSRGSNQVDQFTATNTITAPASGSGTIFIYWTNSGCAIKSNSTNVTATGSGPCAVTSTSGTGFPNDATALIASIPWTPNTWGTPANFQPTAANPPVVAAGNGILSTLSAGTQTLSIDTSVVGGASPYNPQVPALGSMTQIGFTGTAWTPTIATADDGTLYMQGSGQSIGDIFAGPYTSISGSAPYMYMLGFWPAASQNNFLLRGISIRNSSSGKFVSIYLLAKHVDPTVTTDRLGYEIVVAHHTQPASGAGTFGGTDQILGAYFPSGPVYLGIKNDGTNFDFYVCSTISQNTCQQVAQITNTTWSATYDQVGWFFDTVVYGTDGVSVPATFGAIAPMDVFFFKKVL